MRLYFADVCVSVAVGRIGSEREQPYMIYAASGTRKRPGQRELSPLLPPPRAVLPVAPYVARFLAKGARTYRDGAGRSHEGTLLNGR
jgi:hypothetical protein